MAINHRRSSCPMKLLTISWLLFHLGHGLTLHPSANSNPNSTNSTAKTLVIDDNIRNDDPEKTDPIGVGEEAGDQVGKLFTIEDLLAVESQVPNARVLPEDDVPVTIDEEQVKKSAALKREIHEIDVPKLDEAGLNYEFLYRAWEDLHGLHRYGQRKLHTQAPERQKFHHREERKNGTTRGQYRFRLPNGKIQVVSYRQIGDEYLAKVTYLTEEQEHECLGISEGCKLSISDIDIGEFNGDVVVGSSPGSSYDTLPIIHSNHKNPQDAITRKPSHSFMEVSSYQTPTIPFYLPPEPDFENLYEHRPTNIRKSPGLFNEMKKNLGIRYGINEQVFVGNGYGGGGPAFNYGPGSNGSIIDFTDEFQTKDTKEKKQSPEGPYHEKLEKMKAYFDPILSADIPIQYVSSPKTAQGHAEFFIPSNKTIKHFHSQEKVVGSRPVPKSKKTFSAFEQPSVTISPSPVQYASSDDLYGDDFVDDYYEYGEDVYPTTYKPPYIPIFVKRPEGPIDPNYINLPSFSKSAIKGNGTPKFTPDYVESSYESSSEPKHDDRQTPHLADFASESSKHHPDTEGRNQVSPPYGVSTIKPFHRDTFIEDHRVPPTAPQLIPPPINRNPSTHIPSHKSTIPTNSQHFLPTSRVPHFPMPTTSPSHVSTTFRPSDNLNIPAEPHLSSATLKPTQHSSTPNINFIYPSNSNQHSQYITSQSDNIPTHNSKVTIHPADFVKSVPSFTDSENIHPDFIQIRNTQSNSYLPPVGIEPFVSFASQITGNNYSPGQPPHPVRFHNQQSFYQALPTKPIIFTSGFVPSSSFSEPVTRSKIPSPSSPDTIEHSLIENSFPTGVRSSPQLDKFPRNEGDISSSSLSSLLYDPHNVKSAPQYPPLGNPSYRTSIIRFPDSESDLRLVPADRPRSQTGGDIHRNRIIDFKLAESQHSASEAFESLDKFHAEYLRTNNPISQTHSALARKLLVSQRTPSKTRQINTHEVTVSKSSSSHHKKEQTHPQSHFISSHANKQGLRNAAETGYHLYHPPIAGAVSPERYYLRPRYPYPPYRIPKFVPLFYPFYGDVTVPVHPLARTLVVSRSRRVNR